MSGKVSPSVSVASPILVLRLAVLFAESASAVDAVIVAVLTTGFGPTGVVATRKVVTIVRDVPAGTVPSAQGNGVVQSPLFDTNVSPAGIGSSTTTAAASLGPALAIASVVTIDVPRNANPGPSVVMLKSARGATAVVPLATLSDRSPSADVVVTVAVFTIEPGVT